ncbi:MAG: hypothetical protein CMF22_10190 [Idiomarinaceae bacterium]|nr:hypothetical protein [Idiomarinaceae bacterium]MBG23811.1 hypothetical protein [Idiomarinaceae bacterium]
MATVHQGMNNTLLGRILTDEEFTVRIHHVTKLIKQGFPVRYYRDKFGRLRVYRNGEWWVLDDLAKVEPIYDWRKND